MNYTSRLPKFYSLSLEERRKKVVELLNLSNEEESYLQGLGIDDTIYDVMIENVIGKLSLPFGIATNFVVNGNEHLVTMSVEESSIVAAASNLARVARIKGGFQAEYSGSFVIGQIQVLDVQDFQKAQTNIQNAKEHLLSLANATNPILVKLGGGAQDLEIRIVEGKKKYLVVHLTVDTKDAMGANAVNTMLEHLQEEIEKLTEGRVLLRILSNFATKRMVKVQATFDKESLGGENVVDDIISAYDFADHDVYRAVTHNKGVMNGIISVMMATGNDTRAVEAGAHAYASHTGRYRSLTQFEKNGVGDLIGKLELPLSVGTIGGSINVNPMYKVALKIMNVTSASELTMLAAAVGLAQNVAALRALAVEGIQRGHMSLHARNIAVAIGAKGEKLEKIAQKMIEMNTISYDKAREYLEELKEE